MPAEISVVVPTLNSARTLDMTLMSLRLQIGCEAVIRVVDSGSSDGTLEICERWKIPVLFSPPGNLYRAVNQALTSCNTPWMTYVNSDDYLYPKSLERLVSVGSRQEADIVYGACDCVDSEGRFLHSFTPAPPSHLLGLFRCGFFGFSQQTTIFRKEVFTSLSGFDEQFDLSADFDFYLRALVKGYSFARLGGPSIAVFRLSRDQLSSTRMAEVVAQWHSSATQSLDPPGLGDRYKLTLVRARNLPQYCIRILRRRCLGDRRFVPRTMDGDVNQEF